MLRGFLAGGLWGAVIGAVVIALTSQLADFRDLTPAITAELAEEAIRPGTPGAAPEAAPNVVAEAEPAPVLDDETPLVEADAADEISAPMLDTAPPEAPIAGALTGQTEAPAAIAEVDDTPEGPALEDTPTLVSPKVIVAQAPPAADAPPEPGVPALAPASSAPSAKAEIGEPTQPETGRLPETAVSEVSESETPRVAALAPSEAPSTTEDRPATPDAPDPVAAAPEASPVPAPAPSAGEAGTTVAEVTIPQTTAPAAGTPERPTADAEPSIDLDVPRSEAVTANGAGAAGSGGGSPQVLRIADGNTSLPGKRVSGLPGVGDQARSGDDAAAAVPEVAVEEDETTDELSALDRNRIEFSAPEGAGLIAVVLVHTEGPAFDLPQDEGLPIPLTLAVPARLTEAATIARTYRQSGHEVVLIPDLPQGASAQDAAVALPVNLAQVPSAVALMDANGNEFQDNRGATESVVAAASESGLGLVTWPKGFNTAGRMASQEGVPSATVFRELAGGDARQVARILDQAAFRARQEGGVVLVGPAVQEVVDGLKAWSELTRRSDISLAPLSAVLLGS